MKENKEIERRYILKGLPLVTYKDMYDIIQYYIWDDGIIKRLRKQYDARFRSRGDKPVIEYLYKTEVGNGQFIEHVEDATNLDIDGLIEKSFKRISKTRYVHHYEGLKFEIDIIDGVHLVILEVELSDIDEIITFPEEISSMIIAEVTGVKGFSNFALATRNKN